MKKREIEKQLYNIARQKVTLEEEKKEKNIQQMLDIGITIQKNGTLTDFICSQINFLNKTIVFWQILWIVSFLYLLKNKELFFINNEMLCFVSMAPPLLLLLTIEEISKTYQRSMLEIEYATKYSLKRVVMVRLLILSVTNGIVLLVGVLVAKNQLQITLADLLLYGMTPLICMANILLMLMKKWMGEQLKYAAFGVYVIFGLIIAIGRIKYFNIYTSEYKVIWMLLLVCGVVGVVYQIRRMQKYLNKFELMMEA